MVHTRFEADEEEEDEPAPMADPPFSAAPLPSLQLAQSLLAGGQEGCYVLELATSADGALLAASLSDFRVALFTLPSAGGGGALAALSPAARCGHAAPLVHLSFPRADAPSALLSGCADGALRLFDARAPGAGPVLSWADARCRRELSAAAAQPAGDALAAGAEDGCVLLWDRRVAGGAGGRAPPLACWEESQSGQPVTVLSFNPQRPSALVSAGTDGLACVFDLGHGVEEEEALQSVLQAGCSCARAGWLGARAEGLWVASGTEELSVWDWAAGERVGLVDWEAPPATAEDEAPAPGGTRAAAAAAAAAHPPLAAVDYLVGCEWDDAGCALYLLAGSAAGALGAWPVALPRAAGASLALGAPAACLAGGHSDVVRCARLGGRGGCALTGGEDGRICLWRAAAPQPRREGHSPAHSAGRYSPY